ncbi:MAG TPA: hypothetical protein RMH85_07125 [Polyangiaceae bacterium LLY-WYZ-15_(1-7)]|nr:hypothetical protein [Polyangiaceae bacterium LLY-WYZ-15_(1-7)]HJL08250.1 hypothetical protein [Polyangiaceae bacterium LLY-WYZ-15_(1-7)]HJL44201.1 hypothetical protein [Polyangiaceae bacterium LLY-WYZ-15_(1-7)]
MRAAWLASFVLAASLGGCDFFDKGDPPPSVTGRGVGEDCSSASDCRTGLVCDMDRMSCQPAGTAPEGGVCQLTGDCGPDLYCAADRTCSPAGDADEGARCGSTADCLPGLSCVLRGFYAECRPAGTGDIGELCENGADCLAGLSCIPDPINDRSQCLSPPAAEPGTQLPPAIPSWSGVECPEDVDETVSYFEVPRFDETDGDFYRLPFPNDVRRTASGLDLRGHPTPDTAVDVDIIDRYLRASEEDLAGFSTNPVVYFRFSEPYDWDTVGGAIRFVDVDPDSPDFGRGVGFAWLTTFGPITNYICEDWLGVRTGHGAPLRPDTTYAVVLTRDLQPSADVGGTYARDADLDAMLGASAPGDATLAAAWEKYAPLRDYLAGAEELSADQVLNATVFTTQPATPMARLREAVHAAELPAASELTACGAGVTSPCDDGTPQRSCEGADGQPYTEIHGRLSLPIFQGGRPPYATPEDGGAFEWVDGQPRVQRTEEVCFALTVPEGSAPAEGWPLLVAAHGTNGSFRTAVGNGLASAAAGATTPGPVATLAIDLPQHGERRGESEEPPDILFFNFLNPRAARDNVLQGAADLFAVVRWALEGGVDAAASPTGEAIAFDPARVALYAHSQGATHADLMVPHEPGLAAVVFSGNSGDLTLSLLNKTSPTNIQAIVPFALLDADGGGNLRTGDFHPALALFQGFFDGADPVNHALALWREPADEANLKHVFMTFGLDDTYTPEVNQRAYAVPAGFPHVAPRVAAELPLAEVDAGLSGNVMAGEQAYTIGLRSYAPDAGDDGHFVASRTEGGRSDVQAFLFAALAGEVPTIE